LSWAQSFPTDAWTFLGAQGRYLVRGLTWPGVVALVVAFLWQLARCVRRRACFEQGLLLALSPPGFLYIALAPSRSINHDFFAFVSLPWMALSCAWLWSSWLGRLAAPHKGGRSRVPQALTAAALAAFAAVCIWRTAEIWRAERRAGLSKLVHSEWLAPLLDDPRAVLVASTGAGLNLPFYSRAPLLPGVDTVAELEELRARVLSKLGPGRRVAFLFDLHGVEALAELRAFLGTHATAIPRLELASERPPLVLEQYDLSPWAAAR
jgi:hypothetical protein